MYKRLPIDEKLIAVKRVLAGERVSRVCHDVGISRTIFYKWLNNYKKTGPRGKRKVLTAQVIKGNDHWKSFGQETKRRIIKLALKKPLLSPQKMAEIIDASPSGIWYILKKTGLNTHQARLQYIYRNGQSLVRAWPVSSKLTMMRRFENGERVAAICRDFGVSRTIFYRWLKRYEQERSSKSLESLRPVGEEHYRYVHQAPELISEIVARNPEFSPRKISAALKSETKKQFMSPTGVYYVLKRLNLNTYQRRLAFAQSNVPSISLAPEDIREEKIPMGNIPSVSSLAPPSFFGRFVSSRFFLPTLLTFILALSAYIFISTVFETQGLASRIGMVFSFAALLFGMFFFIYSLKYYLTIAMVLSFSRRSEEKEGSSFMSNLFSKSSYSSGFGLNPDLGSVPLDREPLISVHVALYNEKRVVERLLTALTSFAYENYEIVIADDSTDETQDLLSEWSKHPRVKICHRENREGFKGGALGEALKVTDPRAEYILVFDADFIPYPDTITQFLKYFQSLIGGLSKEKLASSSIAAVQGYQWHVLNKSENWVTRGVRSEYAGSYVIERSGEEIYGGLKQISGSVYMIRRDILEKIGWGTSITEDFQLTLKLYEKGYKVVYTPYVQAPAEAVSTIKRLIRQRMRWAEGHSFNIRRMFRRLMFGHWQLQSSVLSSQFSDIGLPVVSQSVSDKLKTGKLDSDNRQQRTDNRIFIPSPLSLSEKLEFIYLSPYYLQAAFFIAGTLSWFIAEVIFRVRLPFWTEIWGWSLIFTNMLALPLMNMVGLFLEESEEKDYLGLFSFIAISYIVAPFQAYAAVKGFLEQEEGPWFRTPKTGRITDVFTPGRFYRYVRGIFGRPAPALSMTSSPAFAQGSVFNNFILPKAFVPAIRIRPKKMRVIGRSVVVALLILTMSLNMVSFGQNNIFSLSGKKALLVEAKSDFQAAERPEFSLKIPQKAPETKTLSLVKRFLGSGIVEASEPEVRVQLFDSKGQEVKGASFETAKATSNVAGADSDFRLALANPEILPPGKYTLSVKANNPGETSYETTQDFTWGVLAINTNKSIYVSGEVVKLGFGTLDDRGKTLCSSKLNLEITSPTEEKTSLSSDNGRIKQSGECNGSSVTNTADYLAEYQVQEVGTYNLHLTAKTDAGERSIEDAFEVRESVSFDIERVSYPTRIYPPADYPVEIKITANQDFKGTIKETVPSSFTISTSEESKPTSEVFTNNVTIEQFNNITTQGDKKVITWDVNWRRGSSHMLGYTIKFPRKSPEFYLVGPLQSSVLSSQFSDIGSPVVSQSVSDKLKTGKLDSENRQQRTDNRIIFAEQRQWQIAADVVATKWMEAGMDETNGVTGNTNVAFWTSTRGTIAFDTGTKKTGLGSMKLTSDTSNPGVVRKDGVLADAGRRITTYRYWDSMPTSNMYINEIATTGSTTCFSVHVNKSGSVYYLQAKASSSGTTVTGTHTVTTGTWYRIAISYTITNSTTFHIKVYLDGTLDVDYDSSVSGGTLGGTTCSMYKISREESPLANGNSWADDVYIDDGNDYTDPGDIRVTAKLPNAESTNNFDTAIGTARSTTDYNNVNERPLSETNGWQQAATADRTENYGIQNAATGDADISGNPLVARTAWVWAKRAGGSGSCSSTADMWDNNSASAITLGTTSALYTKITDSTSYPTNPAAGMNSCTAAQDTYFYETGVLIAFTGDPVPELALLLAPLSFFAPKIIKSIQKGTLVEDTLNLLRRMMGYIVSLFHCFIARLASLAKRVKLLRRVRGVVRRKSKRQKY